MHNFHLTVFETTRLFQYQGRGTLSKEEKDTLSKYVNMSLTMKLSDDEQVSLVKIMEAKLAAQ